LWQLNPYGKVPVLVDGDAAIYESNIVNEYLDEKYPAVPLMPRGLLERAHVRIWMDFCNSRLHTAAHEILHGDAQQGQEQIKRHLGTLNQALAGRDYLDGGYSLADVTFIPFFIRRERYRFTVDDGMPDLKRWMERLLARPAVKSTL